MKERQIYRGVLVCWNDWRCVGWRTEKEFDELMEKKDVTWFSRRGDKVPTYVNGVPARFGLPPKPDV